MAKKNSDIKSEKKSDKNSDSKSYKKPEKKSSGKTTDKKADRLSDEDNLKNKDKKKDMKKDDRKNKKKDDRKDDKKGHGKDGRKNYRKDEPEKKDKSLKEKAEEAAVEKDFKEAVKRAAESEELMENPTITMDEDERFRKDLKLMEKSPKGKGHKKEKKESSDKKDGERGTGETGKGFSSAECYPEDSEKLSSDNEEEMLTERLSYLQRRLMDLKIPVVIVLEGAYAAGKGRVANELLLGLDARYTKFHATREPSEEELKYPFLDQYFKTVPSNNNFIIYYRSWYSLLSYYRTRKINQDRYRSRDMLVDEIKGFEKSLADNGYVLIKFKIRIDPDKQAEHIKKMMESPLTTWKAQEYDRDNNELYVREMDTLMNETDTPYAPWYVIEYTNKKDTTSRVMKHVIKILEKKLEEALNKPETTPMERDGNFTGNLEGPISSLDLTKTIDEHEYEKRLKDLQNKMREIQYALYQERIPLVLVFEGQDAAGKGGGIHRILTKLDPTNYTVNTTAAPNDVEKSHHYLWRFAKEMPRAGHIALWDRSWYGRVMVERVEGFATNEEWSRAYEEINNFEKSMTDYNAIVIKFFVVIDKDTQLERFRARAENPAKSWKITDEDWRNRDKWDKYTEAVNDMIEKTDTKDAPWVIVEGNSKQYARIKILETIIRTCDKKLKLIDYSDEMSRYRE